VVEILGLQTFTEA